MTEPIKLPPIPYAPVQTPSLWDGKPPEYREAHMRGYAIIAVEQATAEMRKELEAMTKRADEAERFADHQTWMAVKAEAERDEAKSDMARIHHALKDAGVHPGRTDDPLTEVIGWLAKERDEAIARAESAEAGQSDAGFVGLKVMQELDEARAALAKGKS
jgi:chromosome segregation ATPase